MDGVKGCSAPICSHLRRYHVAWGPGEQKGERGPSLLPSCGPVICSPPEDDVLGAGLLPGWGSEGLSLRWGTQEEEPGGDRV